MPELPEVETVRRGLAPLLVGRRILRVEARRPDLRWPLPDGFVPRLAGARVERLERRAKYLLAALDRGETLICHLGMSGRMVVHAGRAPALVAAAEGAVLEAQAAEHPAPARHDHVILELEGGARVSFNDARRFGAIDLWPSAALACHPRLAGLGPEPLEAGFDGAYLARRLAGRTTSLKAVLLDQGVVAGLGNIYVCEALWRAGLSPFRPAGSVSHSEAVRLVAAVRAVLREAIAAGGSSLRDYQRADGTLGTFQHAFAVYGRAGRACLRAGCEGEVRRSPQGGRSTFHCPLCQRA